jgi:hypothetical protein
MTNENPREIKIISRNGTNIFSSDKYIIPLYQRAFAWEDTEIMQMIEDIESFTTDNYYLGTLIVSKQKEEKYEVIDGQQRLTALYLLLTALKVKFDDKAVSFEHRQKSDDTLSKIKSNEQSDWRKTADSGILTGFNVLFKALDEKNERIAKIIKQLKKVNIIRVIVPPNTDLNKYFEIMNNRGKQLEQQDIVKSHLIGMLSNKEEQESFARLWEACSDMSGYVQMHFDKAEREHYFGDNWDNPSYNSFKYCLSTNKTDQAQRRSISEIADSADITLADMDTDDKPDEDNIRFEGFIPFRYFLLHVLKIFEIEEADAYDDKHEWGGERIDDKKLIQRFKDVFPQKQSDKVKRFGACLLWCRFLFDNYMLKREFKGDDTEGKWSLKRLKVYWVNFKKRGKYYPKSDYVDVQDSLESRMLQSMLRVTYTSWQVMHWVTDFLAWLYFNDYDSADAVEKLESIAREPVCKFLTKNNLYAGLDTPHIVFNFLDYLLWQESRQSDFQFEFRNSVEHWYPQKPTESNKKWGEDSLHHFGNLCLVSSELNSKFSNNLPMAKKANFQKGIERQSLKLREMAKKTTGTNTWTEKAAIVHGKEMIEILKSAVHEF